MIYLNFLNSLFIMSSFTHTSYKTLFHNIHCILRDGESALTGMAALNEINNFILLIFIEPRIEEIFGKGNNDKKFSYLVKKFIKNTYVDNELKSDLQVEFEKIIIEYYDDEYLMKYLRTNITRTSVFLGLSQDSDDELDKYNGLCQQLYDIIETCKDFFFGSIELNDKNIKEIFESIDFDMLGDAYEKFKEDEVGNQGKTTGQYFTPRDIIRYCIEEQIKPEAKELSYDSSCGTGGFIHYLDKFVLSNDPENSGIFKKNIYGNDKTADVMKPLFINLLLHNISIDNIKNRNSLGKTNCKELFEKFDICVGNPPYGVKNKIKFSDFNKLVSDDFNYWPSFLKTTGGQLIKDSMGQFLVHVINSLKVGGRFSLVIDRGILNNGTETNSWQKKLRKWFLTCCDLKELILLPKGIFTHTMFDTAIIYGVKKVSLEEMSSNYPIPSTQNVKVYEGEFKNEKDRKGLKVHKECPNVELSIEEIVEKDWSLKYDDYIVKEDISEEGIEYKTLGEVCAMIPTSKHCTKIGKKEGLYRFYNSSQTDKLYLDTYEINKESIIIGNGGKANIHMDTQFTPSKHVTVCNINEDYSSKITTKYLFIYLRISINIISKDFSGGGLKWLNRTKINKILLPILPEDHQQRIVDFMDEFIGEDYQKLDMLVSKFKDCDLFKLLIKEDYDTFGLAIEYINKIIKFEGENRKFNEMRKKCCFKTVPFEYKPLGEVCEFEKGTFNTKDIKPGDIPYYNASSKCPILYHNDYTIDYPEYIIFVKDGGDKNNILNLNSGMAKSYYVTGKSAVINHNIILKTNEFIKCKFLYYFMESNRCNNMKLAKYNSGLGNITKSKIEKIMIPVPSLEDQQKVVEMIEAIDREDSQYNQMLGGIKDMIETVYKSIENITA